MEPVYDPKLKEAMKEIREICKKHDIASFICLSSQTHGEFGLELPKWQPLFFEGQNLRFKSVGAAFNSKAEHIKSLNLGAWIVCQFQDMAALLFKQMSQMREMLEEKVEIEHSPMHGFAAHVDPEVLSHKDGGGKSEA